LSEKLQVNKPEPIIASTDVVTYKKRMDPQYAVDALIEGYPVLIADFFSSGLAVLNQLKLFLDTQYPDSTFEQQREKRAAYRELSNNVLLKIVNSKLQTRKSPDIGWLEILYSDNKEFLLPFPQVQGLNSAWQWYINGIYVPVLGRKIHPWYGTYFPVRFEHLELFDNWLKNYKGAKNNAFDIGTGSGVLALQMLKHGFSKVYATDNNPNAIKGFEEYISKHNENRVVPAYGDLFAGIDEKADIIVFNPPWLEATHDTEGLERATYYEKGLFERFFEQAVHHLAENGRIVMLFSNLQQVIQSGAANLRQVIQPGDESLHQVTNTNVAHPIEAELASGLRFQKVQLTEKQVRPPSKRTKRKHDQRSSESVQLWVLKAK